ncbi:MAG: ATP-grasp domain-containing protein [Bifidobacteriaceae bacterium]|jgi:biotin carboxylase|nr:ATP-grasp domain-containing protein [Bifidobacteriaceae bacterium]
MVVLIVDAFEQGAGIANACDKLGIEKSLILSPDIAGLQKQMPKELKAKIDEEIRKLGFSKVYDGSIEYSELIHNLKASNIEAVIPSHEISVLFAERLAHDLGLQVNDLDKIDLRRDKFKMQECLKQNGLNFIDSALTDNIEIAKQFLEKYKKIVLKPNSSAGSDSILVTESEKEIENYFSTVLNAYNEMGEKNTEILVQEFIDGPGYQINCISRNGKHKLQSVGIYKYEKINGTNLPLTALFLGPECEHLEKMTEYTHKVLNAFGVKIGFSHTEVMMSKKGIVLMETATRITGDFLPEYPANRAFQADPFEDVLRAYIDNDFFEKRLLDDYKPAFSYACMVTMSQREGKIKKIRIPKSFQKLKTFDQFSPHSNISEAKITVNRASGIGKLVLLGKKEDIEKDMKFYKVAEKKYPRLLLQLEGDDDELSAEEKNYLKSYNSI